MLEVPVIPENAPFSPEQRLWLNGFLAGYFSRQPLPLAGTAPAGQPPRPASGPAVRILFGSQTGTAQQLARRLSKEANARGCRAQLTDAADFSRIDWGREHNLLLVTSTYGDGEMPDNARTFWDWLSTEAAAALSHVRYSVLALGDRNYAAFCAAGKKLDARLEALGAARLFPRADCDVDFEAPAKAWMDGALSALLGSREANGAPHTGNGSADELAVRNGHGALEAKTNGSLSARFSASNPFPARLLRNVRLSRPGSEKEVRHYELNLQGSALVYEAGDALGVLPINCPGSVDEILSRLEGTGDDPVQVAGVSTACREALASHLDLAKPSPGLLAWLAERAPRSELAALQAPGRSEELRQWLRGRAVIDLLTLVPERISSETLLPLLGRLTPRLYSIASSLKAHPDEVHLTVNTVRYQSHGRERKGVASTFLAERAGSSQFVRVFVQPSHGFRLPADGNTPVIMVGPGTGIAPFRAFLEERQAVGAGGRNWLFFGEQRRAVDFLYEEQLCAWVQSGHLTRLDLAFSRDQSEKVYVQHRMLARAAELWGWLEEGAHFYVCGDAARMARDVEAALHQVAQSAGGKTAAQAEEWVAQLRTERRYQRDVY